jgi:hypothetical protein
MSAIPKAALRQTVSAIRHSRHARVTAQLLFTSALALAAAGCGEAAPSELGVDGADAVESGATTAALSGPFEPAAMSRIRQLAGSGTSGTAAARVATSAAANWDIGPALLTTVSPGIAFTIGYDSDRLGLLRNTCIDSSLGVASGAITQLDAEFKYQDFNQAKAESFDLHADAAGGYGPFSASGSFDYSSSSTYNKNALSLSYRLRLGGVYRDLGTVALNSQGRAATSNLAQFREICGNRFVRKVEYGGELWVSVEIDTSSSSSATELKAKLAASYGTFASLNSSLSQMSKDAQSGTTIRLRIHQEGGDVGSFRGEFPLPTKECSVATFAECKALVDRLTAYAGSFKTQVTNNPFGNITGIRYADYNVVPELAGTQLPAAAPKDLAERLGTKVARISEQLNLVGDLLAGVRGPLTTEKRAQLFDAASRLNSLGAFYRSQMVRSLTYPLDRLQIESDIAYYESLNAVNDDVITTATLVDSRRFGNATLALFETNGVGEVKALLPAGYVVVGGGAEATGAADRNSFLNASFPDETRDGWAANASGIGVWSEAECRTRRDWYTPAGYSYCYNGGCYGYNPGFDYCANGGFTRPNPRTGEQPPRRFTNKPIKVWALGLKVDGVEGKLLRDAVTVQKFGSTSDGTFVTGSLDRDDRNSGARLMGGFRTELRPFRADDWQPTVTWSQLGGYPNVWQFGALESKLGERRDNVTVYALVFEQGLDTFGITMATRPAAVTGSGNNVALSNPTLAPRWSSTGFWTVPMGCGFATGNALVTKIKPTLSGCEVVAHRPAHWGNGTTNSESVTARLLTHRLWTN